MCACRPLAIVPLGCSQDATSRSRKLLREVGGIVVSWNRRVEARGAFARLVRNGSLTDMERASSIAEPAHYPHNSFPPRENVFEVQSDDALQTDGPIQLR